MNTCKCGNELHRDFPDKTERCSGCDRTAAWCRCERVASKFVATWRLRSLARDETGRVAA